MVELVKQSMTNIWASAGDIVMPDPSKITAGWAVEIVPRQYWNWMQNRVDNNIAYLLQYGITEWDSTTEYVANKSYVQHSGVVYKAILTGVNKNPISETTYWKIAFAESTAALEALKAVTPAADRLPYFNGASTATHTTLTSFARTILDDADAATVRTTIGAQTLDATLTALAGVAATTNKLPYFNGTDTATVTDLTAFGRSLIDDADDTAGRVTLGLGNVNNTSDANKPVSTAQQTALDLKANANNASLTGVPVAPTAAVGTNTTQLANTAFVNANAAIKDSDTGSVAIPSGTTAQRTASPAYGRLRANTTLNSMEWWNGVIWSPVGSGAGATGAGQGLAKDQIFNETDILVTGDWTVGQGSMQSGVTVTIASPAVFSFVGHGLSVGQPVRLTTTGALPTGLGVNTQYFVIATGLTADAFQLSATQGGAAVITTGTQSGTHSFGKIKNALVTKELRVASGKSVTVPSGSSLVVVGSSQGVGVADQYVNTFSGQTIAGVKNFTSAPQLNGVDITTVSGIGVGQTWQDVGGSRTVNVVYTNTTGRPIVVIVGSGMTLNSNKTLYVGAMPGIMMNNSGSVTGTTGSATAIVPNGVTYQLGSSNGNHGGWWELR